jgi:hypothetical protein
MLPNARLNCGFRTRHYGTALHLLSGGGQSCSWEAALSPFPESATVGWVVGIGLAGALAGGVVIALNRTRLASAQVGRGLDAPSQANRIQGASWRLAP